MCDALFRMVSTTCIFIKNATTHQVANFLLLFYPLLPHSFLLSLSNVKQMQDVLNQPIDYDGFQLFMATYLENDIPEELCQHLFTSFKSKTGRCSPDQPRAGSSLLGPA
ncbi:hypothetical protein ATANTOWER_008473 [Ataeniobius toweri]|uniref:Diacylglycerol kinase type I N-terminal domain-containing protein n=1 Tax=Ataeniobius toweri TaxID=208326 RepID=A0ABU7ANI1_9TELE|nr:hypothetical protein [Ataeniobius toweri]